MFFSASLKGANSERRPGSFMALGQSGSLDSKGGCSFMPVSVHFFVVRVLGLEPRDGGLDCLVPDSVVFGILFGREFDGLRGVNHGVAVEHMSDGKALVLFVEVAADTEATAEVVEGVPVVEGSLVENREPLASLVVHDVGPHVVAATLA